MRSEGRREERLIESTGFNLLECISSTMKKSEIHMTSGGSGTLFLFLWETFPFSQTIPNHFFKKSFINMQFNP